MSRRRNARLSRKSAAPIRSKIPLDLIDEAAACAILGGISRHTLYRGIAACRYPCGVRVGPNTVRYVKAEVEAALRALIKARGAV